MSRKLKWLTLAAALVTVSIPLGVKHHAKSAALLALLALSAGIIGVNQRELRRKE